MRFFKFFSKRSGETQLADFIRTIQENTSGTRDPMSHPIIRRGVLLIANTAANLPLNIYIDGGKEGRKVDEANLWQYRLNVRPTPYCNRTTWIQTMLRDAIIYGNSYHYISPNGFIWLDPKGTTIEKNLSGLVYVANINNETVRLSQDQVVHIRGLTEDGIEGLSLASQVPDFIYALSAMTLYQRKYFENGTFSNLIWTFDQVKGPKTEEKLKQLKEDIDRQYSGLHNGFKNIVVADENKVQPLSANNTIAQFRELQEQAIVYIAALLGLPPSVLGSQMNSSYASLEFEALKELKDINFWLLQCEQELSSKLLLESDLVSGKRWIEFNRAAFVETDKKTEMDLVTTALNNGLMSEEYAKRKLNLPINKIDGETYHIPSNIQTFVEGEEPEPTVAPVVAESDPAAEPKDAPEEPKEPDEPPKDAEKEPEKRSNDAFEKLLKGNLKRLVMLIGNSNKPALEHRSKWLETFEGFEKADEALSEVSKYLDGLTDSKKVAAENMDVSPLMELMI